MQMETISLNDVLRETEPLLRRTLGGDVELDFHLDPELGWAEVDGIVRQSGGDIIAESEPGSGASFRIFFPRLERPADKLPTVVAPRAMDTTHAVILVVEDEPAVRALVMRVLTSDASQALALLEQKDRWIDLLLTDVVLPRGLQGDGLA
jgi:two-component system, cell cycle sensor histidine kinase and response regulator CckA